MRDLIIQAVPATQASPATRGITVGSNSPKDTSIGSTTSCQLWFEQNDNTSLFSASELARRQSPAHHTAATPHRPHSPSSLQQQHHNTPKNMALSAAVQHRSVAGACMRRPAQRPCVVVRSASAPATQTTAPAAAQTTASVISLSSDEYDEFIAANDIVLVDYYTT